MSKRLVSKENNGLMRNTMPARIIRWVQGSERWKHLAGSHRAQDHEHRVFNNSNNMVIRDFRTSSSL